MTGFYECSPQPLSAVDRSHEHFWYICRCKESAWFPYARPGGPSLLAGPSDNDILAFHRWEATPRIYLQTARVAPIVMNRKPLFRRLDFAFFTDNKAAPRRYNEGVLIVAEGTREESARHHLPIPGCDPEAILRLPFFVGIQAVRDSNRNWRHVVDNSWRAIVDADVTKRKKRAVLSHCGRQLH
jgi:hypothetical protein